MSKSDATSALKGFARIRGNRARDVVETVRRLVIMRELVKRI